MVRAVAHGSLKNKAILVPAALAISAVAPWAITPLLMLGGAYLCLEGFEKIAHRFLHAKAEREQDHAELTHALQDLEADLQRLSRKPLLSGGLIKNNSLFSKR